MTPPIVRLGYFLLAVVHAGVGLALSLTTNHPMAHLWIALGAAALLWQQVFRYVGMAISNKSDP